MGENLRQKIEEAIRKGPVYGTENCVDDGTTFEQVVNLCQNLEDLASVGEVLFFVNTLMRLMPLHAKEWRHGDASYHWDMSNFDAAPHVLKPLNPPWVMSGHAEGDEDDLNAHQAALQGRWRLVFEEGFFVWVLTDKYTATPAAKKFWVADK